MNTFRAEQIVGITGCLQLLIGPAIAAIDAGRPDEQIQRHIYDKLTELLPAAHRLCSELGLTDSKRQIELSSGHLDRPDINVTALRAQLNRIHETFLMELRERKFLYVALDRHEFTEPTAPFGAVVLKNFRSASGEIAAACDCMIAECNTAAVFHLMRVAEFGLRALAYDRRVRIPKNKPIELATWEEIIKELEAAEEEIKGYPKSLAREAQYDFYHGALMQFRAFKNVFRNQIMHTRKSYDRDRALSVSKQVREFMQTLATHLAEGGRTPKVWKGAKWLKV